MKIKTAHGDGITIDDAVLFAIRTSVRAGAPVAVTLRGRDFYATPYLAGLNRDDIVGVYSVRKDKEGRRKAARKIELDLVHRIVKSAACPLRA